MSRQRKFKRQLYGLFDIRTYWLQHLISGNSPGKLPKLTKKRVVRTVSELQKISTEALVKRLAQTSFDQFSQEKRTWRVTNRKGWGRKEKNKSFRQWYQDHIGANGCVYLFWKGGRCIYIGRTGKGGSRPGAHFFKFWFAGITRIDVYEVKRKSPLSALECLAIHRFRPSVNQQKTQRSCPLCQYHRRIRSEITAIFHLRRLRRKSRQVTDRAGTHMRRKVA
jgi:hypothetical protein